MIDIQKSGHYGVWNKDLGKFQFDIDEPTARSALSKFKVKAGKQHNKTCYEIRPLPRIQNKR